MTARVDYYPCRGGVDLSMPPWDLKPGALLLGHNYECVPKGYRRIDGYERFDGRVAPSSETEAVDIEALRALITVVPGEGAIRGTWVYDDTLYAFRDNVGQTECLMYQATASGWSLVTTPILSPGGQYEFITHNFYGSTSTLKMYGVDGVNKAFEFDGTTFAQITTGMTADSPQHISSHKNRLLLTFEGGSLQGSPLGEPGGSWVLKTGTTSIGAGAEITAIHPVTGDLQAVWCDTKILLLQGSGPDDFSLGVHNPKVGALAGSVAVLNRPYFLDNRGLTTLEATQNFGDFSAATFSEKIESVLSSLSDKTLFAEVVRTKNQYRLMWVTPGTTSTNGVIFAMTNEGGLGFTTFSYPFSMSSICNGDIDQQERIFAGGEDGYVYEINAGSSFDGASAPAYLRFPFNILRSPRHRKRFRKVVVDVDSPDAIQLNFHQSFDYNDPESPSSDEVALDTTPTGGYWNIDSWNEFNWSPTVKDQLEASIAGTGKSMSLYMYSELTYESPYVIEGISLQYDLRRLER